jgi:hypothetical protein
MDYVIVGPAAPHSEPVLDEVAGLLRGSRNRK